MFFCKYDSWLFFCYHDMTHELMIETNAMNICAVYRAVQVCITSFYPNVLCLWRNKILFVFRVVATTTNIPP